MRVKRTAASNEMTDAEGAALELELLQHRMEQLQAENEWLSRGPGNEDSGSSTQPARQEQAFYTALGAVVPQVVRLCNCRVSVGGRIGGGSPKLYKVKAHDSF